MARHTRFLPLALLAVLIAAAVPAWAAAPPASPRRVAVLFVGNSFTYYHEMPDLFRAYVAATYPGTTVETGMVAPGGESLERHWLKGEAQRRLHQRRWDFVVLQEQSALASAVEVDGVQAIGPPERFYKYARLFTEEVRKSGAEPVLFQLYAGRRRPDLFPFLAAAHDRAARASKVRLVPIGDAFERLRPAAALDLYDADGHHPSLDGSYLIAVSIAQALFGCAAPSPPDREHAGAPREIAAARASIVEATAQRECLAQKEGGRTPPPEPRWASEPVLEPGDPMTPASLAGTWSTRDGGFRLSLGSQLQVDWKEGGPEAAKLLLLDYGVNARMRRPLGGVALGGNLLRFETESNFTRYRGVAALEGKRLHLLLAIPRPTSVVYRNLYLERTDPEGYFARLGQLYDDLEAEGSAAEGDLDGAVLVHYHRLTALLGEEQIRQRLDGETPDRSEWFLIMTGSDYSAQGEPAKAIAFLRLATRRFPRSAPAFEALGEVLAAAGRLEEALAATEEAEQRVGRDDPEQEARIRAKKEGLQARLGAPSPPR